MTFWRVPPLTPADAVKPALASGPFYIFLSFFLIVSSCSASFSSSSSFFFFSFPAFFFFFLWGNEGGGGGGRGYQVEGHINRGSSEVGEGVGAGHVRPTGEGVSEHSARSLVGGRDAGTDRHTRTKKCRNATRCVDRQATAANIEF